MNQRKAASSVPDAQETRFFTLVVDTQQARKARLLVESLRAFGGRMSGCPVWVFYPDLASADEEMWQGLDSVHPLPLGEVHAPSYWFSRKTHACARAEQLAGPEVRSLVWLAPENLFVQPPVLFDLGLSNEASPYKAAFRTVHHANIGSPADRPLDAFWRTIYNLTGLDDAPYTTRSYIDGQELRPYWNTHCFAIDPALGLLQAWHEGFCALVDDERFQAGSCHDVPHQVFLHQAVLSTLVAQRLPWEQVRLLPPEYNYPLNLLGEMPPDLQVPNLNSLVNAVYEGTFPSRRIEIHEPLCSWLVERLPEEARSS